MFSRLRAAAAVQQLAASSSQQLLTALNKVEIRWKNEPVRRNTSCIIIGPEISYIYISNYYTVT